ncbi:hypothetical protein WL05_16645 [Burkholderia ubonensis]|uniref:hypothetical protein n=1 Tax=Burkholderia ubonensis TaxID=101571 RepID=UPI00075DA297|nr:hypothetical protein [Burkholderia ubonensis]KVM18064.1 hypothetical protein WJ51_08770 [Burkholderia ubonensis]KVM18684.1 hypothetical protein WJ52_10720 [Burkholderia ubonensis]KVM48648.1 hypothetical protein WJ56_18930 [Burkholderia ubonensis]KVX47170.1 hypothetical protein WL05_16645 [Burkholderia ubonensis]KVX96176.1 hypothetical protein WL10_04535 [Burkholderia ubonensis]
MDIRNDLVDDTRGRELAQRRAARSMLDQWWERLSERSSTWDLETVKHLVVLNAAGFAGVATLLAGAKLPHPKWVGAATLLGYGLGVVLAILNMYLASVSFSRMLNEVKSRMVEVGDLSKPIDHVYDRLTAGRRINIAGQVCGWGSAVFAIGSTLTIGISLVN